jgi:CTP synthase
MGIQPDFIVGRAADTIDDKRKEKVAYYCNLDKEAVISNPDCETIYQIPLIFKDQKFDEKILGLLELKKKNPSLKEWKNLVKTILSPKKKEVTVGIIAKYISTGDYELQDSYHSLLESLNHASWYHKSTISIEFINAETLEKNNSDAHKALARVDGIIVPIGWGSRGAEGKIKAITYARTHKVPYLGLCYGMQLASIEYARNVVGLAKANTTEVDKKTPYPIIHDIPFDPKYQKIKGEGASMRLGAYDCVLKKNTLAYKIYDKHKAFKDKRKQVISERHRHRYEFNNQYRDQLEKAGFVISGTSPDDFFVEMIELPTSEHPFFIATQAHPEYKSKPLNPHPLFIEYFSAMEKFSAKKR